MKLNEKIAYYRRDRRLSQEELAAQVGVSRQAVSKWELGEASPDVGKLLALAKAFGVTTDHLLSEDEEPERAAPPAPPQEAAPPPPAEAPGQDMLSRLPGFIKYMVRRWGWLAGIYIALGGLAPSLFGIIGLIMISSASRAMNSTVSDSFGDLGGFGGGAGTIYVEGIGPVQIEGAGGSGISGAVSGITSGMAVIPAIFLVIGLVVIGVGLYLAFVLWKKGRKGDYPPRNRKLTE